MANGRASSTHVADGTGGIIYYESATDGPAYEFKNTTGGIGTYAVWLKPDASFLSGTKSNRVVMAAADANNATFDYGGFGINPNTDVWSHEHNGTESATSVTTGSWQFLAQPSSVGLYLDNSNIISQAIGFGRTATNWRMVFGNRPAPEFGRNYAGQYAYVQCYDTSFSESELKEIRYNPWSHPKGTLWFLTMLNDASATTDFLDYSGGGFAPNNGTVSTASSDGPPVHSFAGGM